MEPRSLSVGRTPPNDKRYTRNQITFVNLVIDYLTQHGASGAGRVCESPFTSVAPQGPEAIFTDPDLDRIFGTMEHLTLTAAAA